MAAVAIDPFDSDHACYGTGATIWATNDFSKLESDQTTHWSPWVKGIEETAILILASPTDGPHLISGFGDIGGFTHDDLDVTPPTGMHQNPMFNNTDQIDFAEKNPKIVLRSGPGEGTSHTSGIRHLAYSEDGGHTWKPVEYPPGSAPATGRGARGGGGEVEGQVNFEASADGSIFFLNGSPAHFTRDHGKTWTAVQGLPAGVRAVADRSNPNKFFAVDQANKQTYISTDDGATFTASASAGLPDAPAGGRGGGRGGRGGGGGGGGGLRLITTPGIEGDLWLVGRTMFHSIDGGANFAAVTSPAPSRPECFSFGMAAPGKTYPALFDAGNLDQFSAVWRSDDMGKTWIRINDDQHQYGLKFRCTSGDPRIYGRVYVGTDGRGIVYGDIAK
jgi:hypothetical protein